ncbi:uncharacterized protein LOC109718036 isoform X1 [Ananas comosus]|uniref:Uncharacterized protein LOC109718036 isoform X1 n=1 Tax=Ananas comosus TaxID=4615 RepID=A0A6P5G2W2_ANACO|nr:uncharacterized protein LOC109718036 isoform X1 [Ananas comosus]
MGDSSSSSAMAAAARRWLEAIDAKSADPAVATDAAWRGGFFDALALSGIRVSLAERGRASCSFRVPAHLTDGEGRWQPGPMATAMDDVGAAAIMSEEGIIKVSVAFDISFFNPAMFNEEVEFDARVVDRKGMLTAVVVEIRKKGDGRLVAVGRQWMSSTRPLKSKL